MNKIKLTEKKKIWGYIVIALITIFVFSVSFFIGIPLLCKYIYIDILIKLLIGGIGTILMFKYSPADTKKRPIVNKKRRLTLKIISTTFSLIFTLSAIFIKNNFLSNSLIFSIVLENTLIWPISYGIFKLPYNNYISFLKEHPDFNK